MKLQWDTPLDVILYQDENLDKYEDLVTVPFTRFYIWRFNIGEVRKSATFLILIVLLL